MVGVPGDPAALEAQADRLERTGRELQGVRDAVVARARATTADWVGTAAPLALAQVERHGASILSTSDACARAGPPLRTLAAEIRRAQQEYAEGQRRADLGGTAVAGAGSGAPAGVDAQRRAADVEISVGVDMMTAAEERAQAAGEAAARELDAACALLDGIVPPSPPAAAPPDGHLGTGLGKAAGDVGREVADLAVGLFNHVNVFDGDTLGRTWGTTTDTVVAAATHPLDAVTTAVSETVAPLGESYRSGGWDEAIGRAPGVLAGVVGGKGLTKLTKLRGLDPEHPSGGGSSAGRGVPPKPAAVPPRSSDGRLGNIVGSLYHKADRPDRVGDGTTADAVRHERSLGTEVQGRTHTRKANETVRALRYWLRRNPQASGSDRQVAENELDNLLDALGRDR